MDIIKVHTSYILWSSKYMCRREQTCKKEKIGKINSSVGWNNHVGKKNGGMKMSIH